MQKYIKDKSMADYFLSFEQSDIPDEIIIHGDERGLIELKRIIQNLIKNTKEGQFDHSHLMTPAWGVISYQKKIKAGNQLTMSNCTAGKAMNRRNKAINK
jgi:hypothetical protein